MSTTNAAETYDLSLAQINERMVAAAEDIRAALAEYRETNSKWVDAERAYRKARALAYAHASGKTVAHREAEVQRMADEEWYAAEMADARRNGAKEALRAAEAILSGYQSVASAHRAEANLSGFGRSEGP